MATSFEKLSFTKDWNNATDFPTYEENETQVRADMQLLHDEVKDFINESLIPGIEGMAVPGAGDMRADVYDPGGMMQDIFAYARAQAAGAVSAAIEDYDGVQVAKFGAVVARLVLLEAAAADVVGAITNRTHGWVRYKKEYYEYEQAVESENETEFYTYFATYADSFEFDSDAGKFTLIAPIAVNMYNNPNAIPAGKYYVFGNKSADASDLTEIYYTGESSTGRAYNTSDGVSVSEAEGFAVTAHFIPKEYVDCLISLDENEYPHDAEQGDYYYEYKGNLLELLFRVDES